MSIQTTIDGTSKYFSDLAKQIMFWFRNLIPGRVKLSMYKSEEISRIRVVKLLEYYKGQMLYYLDYIIDGVYNDAFNRNEMKKRKNIKNIVSYVTNANANLFKNGIILKSENELDKEVYNNIAEYNKLDVFFKEIEKLVFLVKTIFVKVTWNEENKNIKLFIVTPETVEIETNEYDYCKMQRFSYMLNDVTNNLNDGTIQLVTNVDNAKIRFASWTKNEFKIFDVNGATIINNDNIDNINPYGVIPFIRFRDSFQYDSNYIQWPGDDLESAQDNLNLHRTEFSMIQSWQAFSNPVLTNPDKSMFDKHTGALSIPIGPGTPIVLRSVKDDTLNPADFKYATPSPNFDALQTTLDKDIIDILFQYGVAIQDTIPSGNKSSAEAMQQASRILEENRENKRSLYVSSLKELFDVIKIVYNTHNVYQLKEDVEIEILESPIFIDPTVQQSQWDWKLERNLTTLPKILMEQSDDIDNEESAKERIELNIDTNAEIKLLTKNAQLTNVIDETTGIEDMSLSGMNNNMMESEDSNGRFN